jgi:hypothetical protein
MINYRTARPEDRTEGSGTETTEHLTLPHIDRPIKQFHRWELFLKGKCHGIIIALKHGRDQWASYTNF